jgi:site-specific DNA-methyltransferase (adenine-specific)
MKSVELFNDHFQNYKVYGIPKAQLVIADIPYNIGEDAYGSNPMWYKGGDNANGESELAGKAFSDTDKDFRIAEFMHFCSKMLRPDAKDNSEGKYIGKNGKKSGGGACMIVFCAFEQMMQVIEYGARYGFAKYIPLQFHKNYSPQVLKANMRVVGNTEYAILLYRNKLPKFNNGGRMVFNNILYPRDTETAKIHPTQKSVPLLRYLIELFTDAGDVVIDPCAGSGSTLLAAAQCGRKAYGFEIKKDFFKEANEKVLRFVQPSMF